MLDSGDFAHFGENFQTHSQAGDKIINYSAPTKLTSDADAHWASHAFLPEQNVIDCRLLRLCFTSLCDWLAKLTPLSKLSQ